MISPVISKRSTFIQLRAIRCLALLIALSAPGALALAEEPSQDTWQKSPWTSTHPYFNQAGHKLGFGVLNLASGWLSLFYEPMRPGGFFKGFARGIAYTVIYEGGGALHAVTFPIPLDIPLPKGGISFEK